MFYIAENPGEKVKCYKLPIAINLLIKSNLNNNNNSTKSNIK